MQPSSTALLLLTVLALQASCGWAAVTGAAARSHSRLIAGVRWTAIVEAETEDRQFWDTEWSAMRQELKQFMAVTEAMEDPPASLNLAQVGNASASHGSARRKSPLAGLKLNLNPKSVADLVPALEMLKGFYEEGKQRVSKLNAQEKENKKHHAEREAAHEAKIKDITMQKGKVSDGFLANETHDENHFWSYWQRVRERQHHQFHTSLKIQHATLEKEKAMIHMYEQAIAGKDDKAKMAEQVAGTAGGSLPEVSLLQGAWKSAARFCSEALAQVDEFSAELDHRAELPTEEP